MRHLLLCMRMLSISNLLLQSMDSSLQLLIILLIRAACPVQLVTLVTQSCTHFFGFKFFSLDLSTL